MLTEAPFKIKGRKTLLLANRSFSTLWSKTAACFLMYRSEDVVAVLDIDQAGKTAQEVLGFGGNVPVVATMDEALESRPELAIVGTSPMGGGLDKGLRAEVIACLEAGVDVVSGLHVFIDDDPQCRRAMANSGARVWDVRRVRGPFNVSKGDGCVTGARTVLVVGTDCNVGKMTVTLALAREAEGRGLAAAWAATGQTGMILRERGICVDRVISDFVGGATEELVNAEGEGKDVVFVEGQGAMTHPGYAGVALGLLYGAMPDCMILAHVAGRERLKRLETPIQPLPDLISLHEGLMSPFKHAPIVGVTLNTRELDLASARAAIEATSEQTHLPTTDVVRFGCGAILDAVLNHLDLS